MIVIGLDVHKQSVTAVAVDGHSSRNQTVPVRLEGKIERVELLPAARAGAAAASSTARAATTDHVAATGQRVIESATGIHFRPDPDTAGVTDDRWTHPR